MTTTLTRIQRDAMRQAQAGNWRLADAMELVCEGRRVFVLPISGGMHVTYHLQMGFAVGGRLRLFAYSYARNLTDLDAADHADADSIALITDLDGNVVFDEDHDDDLPAHCSDENALYLPIAQEVVDAYHAALATPTQQPLIAEPA
ncbi:hypothetical protein DYQ93_11605 [Xanthomonas sp. LMG 8992]|uniref:hypothetical protein n=1 Tax=Xanthomonas sp. LMG 8992 TaxID=1591157 RepID=UPI0013687C1A|nr:hypothetical protein [Xanthomonas sp. LMG 8992]MXV11666.1 hypothetical protein [Xanthomonas sp. LMG 8992]